ncbi:MAG: hypothetical protein HKP09_08330 [Enterobacterales bacterium]|nr:hypothetical protein [Enterobacterales bacterium]
MKLFDIILITLAGLSLFLLTEDLVESIFSQADNWIPEVFSDAVTWQPGTEFNTALSAVVSGLFLVRFAPQPVLIAFLIGATVELSGLYPLFEANGWQTSWSVMTSSWQTAEKYLQAMFILPLVCYGLYIIKRPNREREVVVEDSRY